MFCKKKAFTLIELLVVVSIIALLVSILLPALGRARAQAKAVQCLCILRNVGQALHMYASENNDFITRDCPSVPSHVAGAWPLQLAPYLGFDGPEDIVRLACNSAGKDAEENWFYHGGYGTNSLLDGDRWNHNNREYVKPPRLATLDTELVYIGDAMVYTAWSAVGSLHAGSEAEDMWHHPAYRHDGLANFVFVGGHAKGVREENSEELRFIP